MKLLFLTGSRSEWGYIKPILELCKIKKLNHEYSHHVHTKNEEIKELKTQVKELISKVGATTTINNQTINQQNNGRLT